MIGSFAGCCARAAGGHAAAAAKQRDELASPHIGSQAQTPLKQVL
jgi:hypothetical protein